MEPVPKPSPLPPPDIIVWGDPVTTIVVDVALLLADIFGATFGGVNSATQKALDQLRKDLGNAIDTVKRFAWSFGRGIGALFTAIGQMLLSLLPAILNAITKLARILKDLYSKVIVPALNALQKIRGMLNDIYNNWIRPIIIMLQRVRQFLAILKALHISWAAKLDARLAHIESLVLAPYLWLVQQLNGIGGWLNIILTTRATIQRVVFKRTLLENMGTLTQLWWATQTSPDGLAAASGPPASTTIASPAQANADFQAFAQFGIGPIADRAASALALATVNYPAI